MKYILDKNKSGKLWTLRGEVVGGGGGLGGRGWTPFFQEIDPLPTQRVPLCTILRYPFLVTAPKIFLKAPLRPIYTNFEGRARRKTRLFCENFPKIA